MSAIEIEENYHMVRLIPLFVLAAISTAHASSFYTCWTSLIDHNPART